MIVLDYENYSCWEYAMRWDLKAKGLWELVSGQEPMPQAESCPVDPDSNQTAIMRWKTRNAQAIALITAHLSEPMFAMILSLDLATSVWQTLAQQAEYERVRRAAYYEEELNHLQLVPGGNVLVFLTNFKQLVAKLRLLGKPIDFGDQIDLLMQALPREEYGGLVDIITKQKDQRPATEQELERICARVLNGFTQRQMKKQETAIGNGSFTARVLHKPASPRHPHLTN